MRDVSALRYQVNDGEQEWPPSIVNMDSSTESWRDMGVDYTGFRGQVLANIHETMIARYREGAEEHGDIFQGEPLEHLREELIDALFYLEVAIRAQEHRRLQG